MRPRLLQVVVLPLLLVLMVVAGMAPATADNPASGPTSSGQDLNVQITGPTGTLPVGTTVTTVNGVVSLGEAPTTEAHVSFVIDDSGSMTVADFMKEKDGAYRMLTKLQAIPNLQVYASLIFFETAVTVAVSDRPASSDSDHDGISDFKEALDARAHVAKNTYTKNAVQAAIDQLSGKSGVKQIYLITDGVPSPSSQNPSPLAPALSAANIQVYTYAIGSQATCSALTTISTKCTVVSTFDDLPSTITGQTVAGISDVKVRVNGGAPVIATIGGLGDFSAAVTGLHAGANTVEATATASDGTSVTATSVVTVGDLPTVHITDGPGAGYQDDSTASWSFASADTDLAADPYACKVDDGDYAPCTSPYSTDLADGTHTFSVTATDLDGNVSEPATAQVRIDTTAPAVEITAGPQGTVTTADAHLTFTVTEANLLQTECRIDEGELQACTAPVDLADLANGPHSLEVVATDAAGNTGRDTRSWTVDRRADNVITFAPVADQVLSAGSVEL
ncbi:MAG TPA: VWA domain-containing protein, partial [Nocardioides sp.]|nr:VWA domain-containing protein [Nocardioides sp.]